jgi:hypothetical protein
MAEENTMFADTVQIWVDEWLEEGEIKGEIKGKVLKIANLRNKLENPSFWQDIDQRLEKLKDSE